MKGNSKKAINALIFRSMAVIIGLFGIIGHMFTNFFVTENQGFMIKHKLAYFTLQTNIFSVSILSVLVISTLVKYKRTKKLETSHISQNFHMACTIYITVTMLGFWLVLVPFTGISKQPFILSNSIILHTVTPILAILDYFLFSNREKMKKTDVFKFLSYPIVYLIFINIYSPLIKEPFYSYKVDGKTIDLMYPYPFLDPSVMGVRGVILSVSGLAVFFVILGSIYIFVNNKLQENTKEEN